MKHIIFAGLLAVSSVTAVQAQNATSANTAVSGKAAFTAKVNEWASSVSNKSEASQKLFGELAGMMQTRMSEENRELAAATTDAEKNTIRERIKLHQGLYADIKVLSVNMNGNAGDMREKLNKFLQNY